MHSTADPTRYQRRPRNRPRSRWPRPGASGSLAHANRASPPVWRDPDPYTEECFWSLVTSRARRRTLPLPPGVSPETLRVGCVDGRLLGGCCSLVASLLGTPFQPDFRGTLLFLEDVREELHRIHRMLTQFELAGILGGVAGLILGQFTAAEPELGEPHLSLAEIYRETLGSVNGPILANLPYGHIPRKLTLPQGVLARLDAGKGRLTLLESAVV